MAVTFNPNGPHGLSKHRTPKPMGLDITYYRNIAKIDCLFDQHGTPVDAETRNPIKTVHFQAFVNWDFPGRACEIEDECIYSYEDIGGFRAGSYGGYNHWRNELAKLAGYAAVDATKYGTTEQRHDAAAWAASEGPFWELIYFSDCEGVIGAAVSAKLASDFAAFQDKANSHEDEYFRRSYQNWRTAFEAAAQNGAVHFH